MGASLIALQDSSALRYQSSFALPCMQMQARVQAQVVRIHSLPMSRPGDLPCPGFLYPAGADAGPGGVQDPIQYTQPRPYDPQDLLQLLQVLAQHRPNQKLPTLYVYNESLNSRDRPGLLELRGSWRTKYIEVRYACIVCLLGALMC